MDSSDWTTVSSALSSLSDICSQRLISFDARLETKDSLMMNVMAINSANDNNINAMAVDFQLHDIDDNALPKWNREEDKWEASGRPKWLRTGTTDGS